MDIKAKIEEITKKIKGDKDLMKKFQQNPVAALEGLLGVDLPDDQIEKLVAGVKAKLGLEKLGLDDLGGALGGIFGKK